MAGLLASILFVLGYGAIAFEQRLFINKAASALILAAALWVIASLTIPFDILQEHVTAASSDQFGLVVFLLTSMTLVEVLLHYRFFDVIEARLRARGWNRRTLGWAIAGLTFLFSMLVPNFTATIVGIQIMRRFFPKKELIAMAALIIIAANAGGAFSPIGDVVTLLLWFGKKFGAGELLAQGALPAVALTMTSGILLLRTIGRSAAITPANGETLSAPSRSEWAIIIATLCSFILPLAAAAFHLPPYMGLLIGLGIVWSMIDLAKVIRPKTSHLEARIDHFFRQSDLESIQFFVGILLSVAALNALGLLDIATQWLLGTTPSLTRLVADFTGLGLVSAVMDNVPLTAAAISAVHNVSSPLWVLFSLTIGTGGSILVIGSAAGVVAMGMLDELEFGNYMKVAAWPALAGFAAGILVWLLQYWLFLV